MTFNLAKAVGHDDELFNEISFIADFVMSEVGGGHDDLSQM